MAIFTTDLVELFTLTHRILRDEPPPQQIDAICFFGQTEENDKAPLAAIAERWRNPLLRPCPSILVGACEPIDKSPFVVRGDKAWKQDLENFGVDRNSILVYPMSTKFPPSTDAEAWGMVEVIKKNKWKRLVVTVTTLHAIRAFVTLVSACKKNGLEDVAIWSAPAEALPWDEVVCHSGGMAQMPREKHAAVVEFAKVSAYCAKGDHLAAKEILDYLRGRNALAK